MHLLLIAPMKTGEVIHSDDLSGTILDFCQQIGYNDGQCDLDNDGIRNQYDHCPRSNIEQTIVIDRCDSKVRNEFFNNGCTMSDRIARCADAALNHGKFVKCVSDLTNNWKKNGKISERDKGAIQECAAKADIP